MHDFSWGIAVGIIIIAATVGKAYAALLRAKAARLERGEEGEDSPLAETVDALQQRVGDLEERVDFAERMLAKQREGERLPPQGRSGL